MWQTVVLVFAISLTVEGRVLWTHKEFDPKNYLNGMNATHAYDHDSGSVVKDPAGGNNHVLKVFYEKGHWGSNPPHQKVQFFAKPIPDQPVMTLSYDLYLSQDFDFRRGGKLPGFFGGWTNCSGGRHADQCFSTRFMWREDGDGEVYSYIPDYHHQVPGFCDQLHHFCKSVKGYSLGRGSWKWKRGQWQQIAQSVRMNTIGKTDGGIKVWHEGKLVYERNNIMLRTNPNLNVDGIFFSTFFGGSDSSWAPTHDCYSYFKNFALLTDTTKPTIIG